MDVGTRGDGFLAVFPSAVDAVAASVAAQRLLAEHVWPADGPIRVRMGMHSGEGTPGGDEYVGLEVHLAARIAAAGHGGQVLLSEATRALVVDRLPDGVRLQPLGTFRLKDFPGPERLHQLEIAGLPSQFPPLRAVDVRRAHVPPEMTSFIGRSTELKEIARLLAERRLVTLTGPGGTGKTRLALRTAADVADRFPDGTFFVALATVRDVSRLPVTIAAGLELPEEPGRPAAEVLRGWLGERELLLVLDNLEQIEGAGPVVDDLLASTPNVRVLATSRAPLRISGEQEVAVPPLPVPHPEAGAAALAASEAVRLFVDRGRLVRSDISPSEADLRVIADIVERLDGLPLAIELAAARVRLLSPTAIRNRLRRRLDALAGGPSTVPARQRSLRETIAWSHDLLDEPERALFRRLGVFVGGWTFETAEAVCASPPVAEVESSLERLALQSLIQPSPVGDDPRFTMLQTIGDFARERLEASGEAADVERRHTAFFRRLAEEALGPAGDQDRKTWFDRRVMDRLEADLDNLRAAIERAVRGGEPEHALAIAAVLRYFWLQRNHGGEGLRTLIALIDEAGVSEGPEFAAATAAASAMATWLGDFATGRRIGEVSVEAYRRLGDRSGCARVMATLGFATIEVDPEAALALNTESLEAFRELGDIRGEGQALLGRATAQFALGRLSEARESVERSLEKLREAGDHHFALFSSIFLGRIKLLMGDAEGINEYRSVLETSRAVDLQLGIAIALEYLGEVAVWVGDVRRAVRLGAVAERLRQKLGGGIAPQIGGALEPLIVGRKELPAEVFESEVATGRTMDIDSAIAEALALEPPSPVPTAPPSRGVDAR